MRGYFGIGSERISKAMNLGAVLRTAHAFNAAFVFTIGAQHRAREIVNSDTSRADAHVPLYSWETPDELLLPKACALVGVELDPRAVDLPTFRHPLQAAYLLGPEKGSLSEESLARCDYLIKIPTKFCVNLSVAAAIVMYDRTLSLSGYPPRTRSTAGAPPVGEWTPRRPR
ncbi:MAG: TrmH family RNA methyltransferase [Alphaproteobacteria bacterium]|nr:TrmH family RNA methyltransferase [Alphaproteobacteria bacterium]